MKYFFTKVSICSGVGCFNERTAASTLSAIPTTADSLFAPLALDNDILLLFPPSVLLDDRNT